MPLKAASRFAEVGVRLRLLSNMSALLHAAASAELPPDVDGDADGDVDGDVDGDAAALDDPDGLVENAAWDGAVEQEDTPTAAATLSTAAAAPNLRTPTERLGSALPNLKP